VAYKYGFSEEIICNTRYSALEHHRDLCSRCDTCTIPVFITKKAEINPFMRAGPDSSFPPPFLSFPKQHSRVKDPPVKFFIIKTIAVKKKAAER
jgi:hypothetical protein